MVLAGVVMQVIQLLFQDFQRKDFPCVITILPDFEFLLAIMICFAYG